MNCSFEKNSIILELNEKDRQRTLGELFDSFHTSKKTRYLCKAENRVLLDGKPLKDDHQKLNGKHLLLHPEREEPDWVPSEKSVEVIYEDPFQLVVSKPAGCIIHGDANDTDCLNARVSRYYLNHQIHSLVRPVHRLDADTSGLVLYSKISFFQPFLDEMLREKKIYRHYQAICFDNHRIPKHFICNAPIGKDRHRSNRYVVSPSGKDARTVFQLVTIKNGYALIGCTLDTGRTHQIRVHLASFGLSIVNDPFYGRPSRDFEHMGLWADALQLIHPITGEKMMIHDETPKDYFYFRRKK